ncbi:hypothetical protein [Paraburkholderia lycopersici]|uniref:Uncharacterized protein n=1 Tax=Paraburkholderia lycopersici TaxID=416944 RepID=A0A1G6HE77_9BURK|nr:hypothetical protein [Paraburkholderia lycopersici]SDB92560.1 hypothetical protein SAMN05421548_102228 [Paraburkholderia lycopersici]
MLHFLEQDCRVIDTSAWPDGLDLDDHSLNFGYSMAGCMGGNGGAVYRLNEGMQGEYVSIACHDVKRKM